MNDKDIEHHILVSNPKEKLDISFIEIKNFKGNTGLHVVLEPKNRKVGLIYKAFSDGEYKFSSYNDYYIPWTELMLSKLLDAMEHLNDPSNVGTQKSLNLNEKK